MKGAAPEHAFLALVARRGLEPIGRSHVDRTLARIARFFARSLFREETAGRAGILQGVDPRARLLAVLLFLASVSLARSLPVLLIHAALPLLAVPLSRIRPKEILGAGLLAILLFSTVMAVPVTLNVFGGGQVILPLVRLGQARHLGPYVLPPVIGITREGTLSAATFLLRVLASGAAVLWLILSTRWVDLLRGLGFLRLPPVCLQVVGMTVCFLHRYYRQAEELHLGKKSRTICRTPLASEQAWVGSRIAAAWEWSLHLMEEVSEAMVARGFRGEMRFPPGGRLGGAEWALLAAVVGLCAGARLV